MEPHLESLADAHRPQLSATLTGGATAGGFGLGGPGNQTPSLSLSFPTVKGRAPKTLAPNPSALDRRREGRGNHAAGAQGGPSCLARFHGRATPAPIAGRCLGKERNPDPTVNRRASAWGNPRARVRPAGRGSNSGSGSGQVVVAASES